ncbi:hypothetical protein DL93DRAFT_2076619 [Clavulina sp. PMI_390]|nr:hypothetical protein DL93DRAFT_2090975 [Clavulina sp. PMI_390]KAF8318031.1 hypothetical protein DL93DRAFT_2076619 [Clavulina sp. PMI_390]
MYLMETFNMSLFLGYLAPCYSINSQNYAATHPLFLPHCGEDSGRHTGYSAKMLIFSPGEPFYTSPAF